MIIYSTLIKWLLVGGPGGWGLHIKQLDVHTLSLFEAGHASYPIAR